MSFRICIAGFSRFTFSRFITALSAGIFLLLAACSTEPPEVTETKETTVEAMELNESTPAEQPPVPQNSLIATMETPKFKSLQTGEKFRFQQPNQEPVLITIDKHREDENGTTFLSGMYAGEKGNYQLTATAGETVTYGRIQTPQTTYTFTVKDGKTTIVDLQGPGNALVPKNPNDAKVPPPRKEYDVGNVGEPEETSPPKAESPPSVDGKTTIDLMVVYSNGFAATHTGDALMTRLNHLVSVANTLYSNSNINSYLRIVHTTQVTYSDNTTNNSALDALTNGSGVFSGIEALRQQHGADLVTLIRPYDYPDHSGCGIAWLLGTGPSGFTYDADHGYAVVSDGSEKIGNTTYYCSEQSLAHELGHNMGSAHDRAHTSGGGAYSYSHGYGIDGVFGTVMSYINPEIDYFSNPSITCDSGPPVYACGISEGESDSANNTLSLNNAAASVAGFVAAKYSADIDGDSQINTTDSIKALMILTNNSFTGTVDSMQDINDDGKLGLAEGIHTLQKSKN